MNSVIPILLIIGLILLVPLAWIITKITEEKCPKCKSTDIGGYITKGGREIHQCNMCGHILYNNIFIP